MSEPTEPKRSMPLAVLSLIIGVAALLAFVFLNRMMYPPFPKYMTNYFPVSVTLTNSSATNSTSPAR